jgi:uncharacterized protein YqeY
MEFVMREKLDNELRLAMKAQNKVRLSTLRLINAAIKDRDISVRTEENSQGVSDSIILQILIQMIKQRVDSVHQYEEAGRLELAERENNEILIIREFLPKQLSDSEILPAINSIILEEGAKSVRDMGKVISKLKDKYAGRLDFSKVAPLVKSALLKN